MGLGDSGMALTSLEDSVGAGNGMTLTKGFSATSCCGITTGSGWVCVDAAGNGGGDSGLPHALMPTSSKLMMKKYRNQVQGMGFIP